MHPSIRNIRKSVAKGLVSLQEKLDSITSQNLEKLEESDVSKHAGEIFKRASEEERQAGEDRHEQDTTSPSHMKFGVVEICQNQPHSLMDMNTSSVDVEKSELLSGVDEMGRALEARQQDSSGYVEVEEPSEVHGVPEDHDSFSVELKELPPLVIAEEKKLNPVVQLQNLSSLVDSDWSSKEDEVAKVNIEVPPPVPDQNSDAQVSGEGLQIDGGRCIVEPGKLELGQESGVISLGNKAKETSAEEQQHTKLLAESLKLSDLEDNNAPAVCSESSESKSSSELKDNISAGGDSERDKDLSGNDMLGTEFVEVSNKTHVNNTEAESNVSVVEGDSELINDRPPAAVGVETKEISDIKEVANVCEVEGEGNEKPGDDMQSAGVEMKEKPDIKEAVNVCQIEGEDNPVDDIQRADTVGLEQRETPEVKEVGKDVGPVEDIRSIEIRGPESEDLSKTTSYLQVKQQESSFIRDTEFGEEAHVEEIANCNSEQKTAVGEDQEMWEDKFDNKEIYENHGNGNIINLPIDEDLMEEELGTDKVKKQQHRELSPGEEIIFEEPGKESDKGLVQENEKLKETVEKLIAAGKEQLNAISSLSERVKDLEKKLSRKKNLKLRRGRQKVPSRYLLQV